MSKKVKPRGHYTPLTKHKKEGTLLKSPLGSYSNLEVIDWPRDLLPEHLWIASLAEYHTLDSCYLPFYKFMDALDEYIPEGKQAIGLISDFSLVPDIKRSEFIQKHDLLIEASFYHPVGRILSLYPENPAAWLISKVSLERDGHLDPLVELAHLRNLVIKLLDGKDAFSGLIRSLPFGRLLKHGKFKFAAGMGVIDLIPKYPVKCTDEEKRYVESQTRMAVNAAIQLDELYKAHIWPKQFWNNNFYMTICRPVFIVSPGAKPLIDDEISTISNKLKTNSKIAFEYLEKIRREAKCDLYNSSKDEVLFGLISRLIRLYLLFANDQNLWSKDVGGIILRCLADTAITFAYLAKKGDNELFMKFIEYGQGQEKLHLLHLQDNYPDSKSLDGRDTDSIAEELGGFSIEMMNIELGQWTKKDTRQLAKDAGMQDVYRLVFSPTSGDVHGTWASLVQSNLCVCTEPLHRGHRLPSTLLPPVYYGIIWVTQHILEESLKIGIDLLNFPTLVKELEPLPLLDSNRESEKSGLQAT
jgi:hypothetical protein